MRRALPASSLPLVCACKVKDPPPVTDEWKRRLRARASIGGDYYATGDGYDARRRRAVGARAPTTTRCGCARSCPRDVRIEFDCWSTEERGDIKVEVFGDGRSFDPDGGAYMATGYEVIFGGWYNAKSIIARLDEHGNDVVAAHHAQGRARTSTTTGASSARARS